MIEELLDLYNNVLSLEQQRDIVDDSIIIVNAYPDCSEKEQILENLIQQMKKTNIQLLLVSHLPVKETIQQQVDYYLYDVRNELFDQNDADYYWFDCPSFYYQSKKRGIGRQSFAVLRSIQNGVFFSKYIGKKFFYHFDYDCSIDDKDLKNILSLRRTIDEKKLNGYVQMCEQGKNNQKSIICNFFAFYISYFEEKYGYVKDLNHYKKQINDHMLEFYMYEKISNSLSDIIVEQGDGTYNLKAFPHSQSNLCQASSNSDIVDIVKEKKSQKPYLVIINEEKQERTYKIQYDNFEPMKITLNYREYFFQDISHISYVKVYLRNENEWDNIIDGLVSEFLSHQDSNDYIEHKQEVKNISVIACCKRNNQKILRSIGLLIDKASYPENLEIFIIGTVENRKELEELKQQELIKKYNITILERPSGYHLLYKYYNEVAKIARGDWLVIWGDDAVVDTDQWDEEIFKYNNDNYLLKATSFYISDSGEKRIIESAPWIFVPRSIYEILGHLSPTTCSDAYLSDIGTALNILKEIDVSIIETDICSNDGLKITTKEYCEDRVQEILREDIDKISKKLNIEKNLIPNDFINNFIDGAYLEIRGTTPDGYKVEFIDNDTQEVIFEDSITKNWWSKTNCKYYKNWHIKVSSVETNTLVYEYFFNPEGKKVLISFDSSSLGDTIAWFPYVEEFRQKHNCDVICSTFWNQLFEKEYSEIEFIKPGSISYNLYATYSIGWYEPYDMWKNPVDYRTIPLQKTASDILGLEYKEIRPKITIPSEKRRFDKRYVCIGIHSSAQAKYWNYPNGWNTIVEYLKSFDYEVVLISKEKGCYMGNDPPSGIIDKSGDISIEDRIVDLSHAEFYIGVGSGLSWLAWAVGIPVILISGFSKPMCEFHSNCIRLYNSSVCHGCFNDLSFVFDKGDWNWCPRHKNFECTKNITPDMVKWAINKIRENKK